MLLMNYSFAYHFKKIWYDVLLRKREAYFAAISFEVQQNDNRTKHSIITIWLAILVVNSKEVKKQVVSGELLPTACT